MSQTLMIQGSKGRYTVGQKLGGTDHYSVYLAHPEGEPKLDLMLKIATDEMKNGSLEREAFLLGELRERAEELEREYARVNPGALLNYQLGFPKLVDSFRSETQGNRRILMLAFDATEQVSDLVSLAMIRERDRVRVDPKTSAWMLGKTLKILAFVHNMNVGVGSLTGDNILVERSHHLVTLFDWSKATRYPGGILHSVVRDEIACAAKETIRVLGGDPESGAIPDDEQLVDDQYRDILAGLACGRFNDVHAAHSAFYQVVEVLWARKFHPYASYPL